MDPLKSTVSYTFDAIGFEHFDWTFLAVIAGRMAIAALLAATVAYRPWRRLMNASFERPESGAQVLIAVAGGLIAPVVGSNTALAFALVGLGGFIRFRSGIKDPREAGVMFFMIGIGLACGVGMMPVALTATGLAIVLLTILDFSERRRRKLGKKRIRLGGVADPRQFEPAVRKALAKVMLIHGSKIALKDDEVVIDISGDRIGSAGELLELFALEGIDFKGDVSCEEF
jgi:hypothetical protein